MGKLTFERANELFICDPEAGVLRWKSRPVSDFRSEAVAKSWNGKLAGKIVGYENSGYAVFGFEGVGYKVHRVIWLMVTGYWPTEIDHIDGDTLNNTFTNFRDVSHSENMKNKKLMKNNKSGHPGIHFEPKKGLWVATLGNKRIGRSKDFQKAIAMRKAAEAGTYHENHGRAA